MLPLSTSYMCGQAFSYLTSMKTKDKSSPFSFENELHVCLSNVWPPIKYLCIRKQTVIGFRLEKCVSLPAL